MEFDIRTCQPGEIDTIRFADDDDVYITATHLEKAYFDGPGLKILEHASDDYLQIINKEHALNLIKALSKAIELGWFEV